MRQGTLGLAGVYAILVLSGCSLGMAMRGHEAQFVIQLPEGWTAYDQTFAMTKRRGPYGMVIFSPADVTQLPVEKQVEALRKMDTGEMPSFFVDRQKAPKGASCENFPEEAQKATIQMIGKDRMVGGDRKVIEPLRAEPVSVGGCRAIRVRGRTQRGDGTEWVLDAHVVSDGQTLYLFSLRNISEHFKKNAEIYERAVSTVKLSY